MSKDNLFTFSNVLFGLLGISVLTLSIGCKSDSGDSGEKSGPTSQTDAKDQESDEGTGFVEPFDSSFQLTDTVVRWVFQDSRGTYWFGTNGRGVIKYDKTSEPEYFNIDEGFSGWAVRGIVEDRDGNIWFGTSGGVTKFDGDSFVNFNHKQGLVDDDVWCITIDSDGMIWVGTYLGVCRFDGESFHQFELPESKPDPTRGVTSAHIVHCIFEDSKGRMWFSNNGGAYFFDKSDPTKKLTRISEKDGLCSNSVNGMIEDDEGNIWFGTHHNGVCRWDGKDFVHFTEAEGVTGTEVWKLYKDRLGNIWFPIENSGVYRFDGKSFTRFDKDDGLDCGAVQAIYQDEDGRFWFGGWMALFTYNGEEITSHQQNDK